MTMIRPAMSPALRPVARAAKAAVMPAETPAPVAPVRAVKAQGAVETGGKVVGGLLLSGRNPVERGRGDALKVVISFGATASTTATWFSSSDVT